MNRKMISSICFETAILAFPSFLIYGMQFAKDDAAMWRAFTALVILIPASIAGGIWTRLIADRENETEYTDLAQRVKQACIIVPALVIVYCLWNWIYGMIY